MSVTIRIVEEHHLKPEYLKKYCDINTFIETGSYRGDAIQLALDNGYNNVYSCDLDQNMFGIASSRFQGNEKVNIFHMDSTDFLSQILTKLDGDVPLTFWLDAHRSGPLSGSPLYGDCPINHELSMIRELCKRNDHTIFIDNKSLYGCEEWGYVRLEDTLYLLNAINADYKILFLEGVRPEDIICATVKAA